MNHFIGESFSYDDIEQVTNNPNVLYRLNVKDQYIISAVTIPPSDIKSSPQGTGLSSRKHF